MAGKEKAEAQKYAPADLIYAARNLFGEAPEMVAGALYGVTEDVTLEEAQAKLAEFKKKGVTR